MIHWTLPGPPEPPFIASVFNYYLSADLDGYREYDERTLELVKEVPGYLGYESFRQGDRGTFISYWKDREAVKAWAEHPVHIEAKKRGRASWYRYYHSIIAEVSSFHTRGTVSDPV
ncbi:MAG: hypothetical protein RJA57_1556 [Bacteroidota bacterium]